MYHNTFWESVRAFDVSTAWMLEGAVMFTGLVQQTGTLSKLLRDAGGWRLAVDCAPWEDAPLEIGESVAVQGVCLTVVSCSPTGFVADLLDETLRRSALGGLRPGSLLNLERALRAGDRLGGHIVQGHVDEKGEVLSVSDVGRDVDLRVSCSRGFSAQCVEKGSIAINGVSLTITALTDRDVSVNIIPHTWKATSLRALRPGAFANLESDVIGKYVARQWAAFGKPQGGLTRRKLEEAGFL